MARRSDPESCNRVSIQTSVATDMQAHSLPLLILRPASGITTGSTGVLLMTTISSFLGRATSLLPLMRGTGSYFRKAGISARHISSPGTGNRGAR